MTTLLNRLTKQVGSEAMAIAILKKRGHLDSDGNLTPSGRQRQILGAEGRAKDRAAKRSGGRPNQYKYNPKTNRAVKKGY